MCIYTGARGINVGADVPNASQVLPPSHSLKFKPCRETEKYTAELRVGEALRSGLQAQGVDLLRIRKQCLVDPGCLLEVEKLIQGCDVIFTKTLVVRGAMVGANVSKNALLTLRHESQLNSEIIDAAMYLVSHHVGNTAPVVYVPSTLLPSKPHAKFVVRNWKWLPQYLQGARQFLFLLHEEYIRASAGHYYFLFVELPREAGKVGKIHIFDPAFFDPSNAHARLRQLSHVSAWVSKFFHAYGVSQHACKFEVKIALPLSHRVHSAPRASLSSAITHVSSRFSMRVQEDGVSCGVVCAQMVEYWLRHNGPPPADSKYTWKSACDFRDVLLTSLCDGLNLAIPRDTT
jgi:hypothetical protein